MFEPEHLRQYVEAEIAKQLPEGANGRIYAVVDLNGVRIAWAQRLGEHWQVAAVAEKPWEGPVEGSLAVKASW